MSFNFGATPASTAAAGPINFSFNASNTSQATSTSGFQLGGATSSSGLGGFSFGAQPTTSSVNPLLGGSTSVATVNPLLATTTATPASSGFSFGSNKIVGTAAPFTSTVTTTAAAPLFGSAVATSAPTGFSLSATVPASSNAGTLFGASTASVTPFSFPGSSSAVASSSISTATSVTGLGGTGGFGLGGALPPTTTSGDASGLKVEGKPSKETPLPQEIFATIAAFESYKGVEKTASEANLRQSAASFHKLGDDCKKLRSFVTELATVQDSLQQKVNAIKEKIIRESEDIEMARRTQNTPAHLQGDNTAPDQFFARAVVSFESHMLACKARIEEVEKCLSISSYNNSNEEAALKELVRRQHEDLQLAAAHVYKLHSKLLQLSTLLPCPEELKPKPLFKSSAGALSKPESERSGVPKESSVIRSCFDLPGGESRLGAFQNNMAKARAMSLNPAPPPTQPLQSSSLFGSAFNSGSSLGSNFSSGTGGLATNFNTPYNNSLGNSTFGTGTFGNTSAFGTGNTSAFGTGNTSAFGTGNTSAFGASNTSAFGTGSATGGFGSASGFGTGTAFASPGSTDQQGSLFSSPFGQSNKMFKT